MQKRLALLLVVFCLVLGMALVISFTAPHNWRYYYTELNFPFRFGYFYGSTVLAFGYVGTVISLAAIADISIYLIRRNGLLHRFSIRRDKH